MDEVSSLTKSGHNFFSVETTWSFLSFTQEDEVILKYRKAITVHQKAPHKPLPSVKHPLFLKRSSIFKRFND